MQAVAVDAQKHQHRQAKKLLSGVDTHTDTRAHQTDCSTWLLKVIGK